MVSGDHFIDVYHDGTGERKGQENLKTDLVRRIKMLEYCLRQERFVHLLLTRVAKIYKYISRITNFISIGQNITRRSSERIYQDTRLTKQKRREISSITKSN